ncbi:MAG: O-antigen ligase family protein [Candidatus Thiodiazotropha sp. (ex Lucinoma kastoroae)]|nr:O-antigen ligase family protein [Candidatus Thiodiazotropha sp. (ex Lucinoma kastoroae)]
MFIILVIAVVSLGYTVDVRASLEGVTKIFSAFCAYGIAYNSVKNYVDANRVVNSIVLASIVPLLFGFYQAITGNYDQVHAGATERVNSVFGVGNAYGIFLSCTICAVTIALLNKSIGLKQRIFFIVLLFGMLASQVLALNRGTWLALTASVILALFPYRKKVKIRWFILGALVITAAFSGVIYERLTTVSYDWQGQKQDTLKGRIDYWRSIIPMILDDPIAGHGIGTTAEYENDDISRPPHNDYIRLAMDIGIPGSILYAYFLLSLSHNFLRKRNVVGDKLFRYNFPMAVLSSYFVVISMTQNVIYSLTNFIIFMALAGTVIKLNLITAVPLTLLKKV